MRIGFGISAAVTLALFASPAIAKQRDMSKKEVEQLLKQMLSGQSAITGKELDAAIAKADEHPLGSKENPVRVTLPAGQRAYLATLRCPDGKVPEFARAFSAGIGVFGNIIDQYNVNCSETDRREVYLDMYHRGHVEARAVPGFTKVDP